MSRNRWEKKFLAFFCAIVMVLSGIPVSALADGEEPANELTTRIAVKVVKEPDDENEPASEPTEGPDEESKPEASETALTETASGTAATVEASPVAENAATETSAGGEESVQEALESVPMEASPVAENAATETSAGDEESVQEELKSVPMEASPVAENAATETSPDGEESVQEADELASIETSTVPAPDVETAPVINAGMVDGIEATKDTGLTDTTAYNAESDFVIEDSATEEVPSFADQYQLYIETYDKYRTLADLSAISPASQQKVIDFVVANDEENKNESDSQNGESDSQNDEDINDGESTVKIKSIKGLVNKDNKENSLLQGDEGEEQEKEDEDTNADTGEEDANTEKTDENEGNLKAKEEGIILEGTGGFDVLISGTLKSEGTPILIDEAVTPENVSITVWKIESPVKIGTGDEEEEHVVLEGKQGETPAITEDSKQIEADIQYIIRIEPSQEEIIGLEGTGKSHGYDVAKEGETVILKISVPAGYNLTGAYTGDGEKVLLEKDQNGNYFVEVPKGGGVYLSAELEKINPKKENSNKEFDWGNFLNIVTYEEYQGIQNPQENYFSTEYQEECEIIFDLNGGTLNGNPGPIVFKVEPGTIFTLLDAPTKPEARFICWASSSADITVSVPGETFEVLHGVKFVAAWEEGETVYNRDTIDILQPSELENIEEEDEEEEDDGPDVTETVHITEDSDEELNLNSIKVEGNPAFGIEITASSDVDVDEAITVSGGDQGATGIKAVADVRTVKTEVETGNGMRVSSTGSSIGIEATASGGGSLTLEFEGSVTVSSSALGSSTGIHASTGADSSTTVQVEKSVETDGAGAILQSESGGKTSIIIGEEK